jgi:hypothetical protein
VGHRTPRREPDDVEPHHERLLIGASEFPAKRAWSWCGDQRLSFFSTTTVFGAPLDVTVAELAIESFYPTDDATRRALNISVQ